MFIFGQADHKNLTFLRITLTQEKAKYKYNHNNLSKFGIVDIILNCYFQN